MTDQNTTEGDRQEPHANISDEIDAIYSELEGEDLHVLVYYGSDPAVALAKRDRAPPTEYPMVDEILVLVEWHSEEDYAVSVARASGSGMQWELIDELVEIVDTRSEALDVAARLFDEYQEVSE